MEAQTGLFTSFSLHHKILSAILEAGYTEPTPIQLKSIPSVLEGKDVLGLAQTGTGKTAAFVLPILQRFMSNSNTPGRQVRALIVVPTRELAEQVHQSICKLSTNMQLRVMTIFGGVNMRGQIRTLKGGCDIVVACPGRLNDHLRSRTIDLSKVECLVLDEADHMFDMGFLPDIRSIVRAVPQSRQTLMFSATMPPEIKTLALDVLRSPVIIQADKGGPAKTVSHFLYPVKDDLKPDLLLKILSGCTEGSVLIFARTKRRTKNLHQKLEAMKFSVTSLQGNLSQSRRREAMDGFRKGKYCIMVATDIAARGIDISSVTHVINFDMPSTVEAYTHRIGRTGRAAKTGSALTLVTRQDEGMVRSIERVLGSILKRNSLLEFDYQQKGGERSQSDGRQAQDRKFRRRWRSSSYAFKGSKLAAEQCH